MEPTPPSTITPPTGAPMLAGDPATAAPLRVLFVDDEPRVLQGLERMLRPLRHGWAMRFADGGLAALAELERCPADVVISDMRMPGMTGGHLLGEIMRRWPATIRIILSGHADLEMVHRTIGPTHQFLQKPCNAENLKSTVQHLWRLRSAIASEPLRLLVGGMPSVPSLPAMHQALLDELARPRPDLRILSDTIAGDLGMSARVLQLTNSAFFGSRRQVTDPGEAATLLGIEALRDLAHAVQAFTPLSCGRQAWFDPERLWRHSTRVSALARRIAVSVRLPAAAVEATAVAGLLHDIGHLLLAAHRPREFAILARRLRDEGDHLGERLVLGSTHGEVAAYLLGLWGFPVDVVDAVAWHHQPWRSGATMACPTTCVHIADALVNRIDGVPAQNPLCDQHLSAVGLPAGLDAWLDLTAVAEGAAP